MRISLSLILLVFFIIGLIVIYATSKSENTFNMIFGIILGLVVCIIAIIVIFKTIKMVINVLNRNYIIIEDELMDKHYYNDHSMGDETNNSCWQLYFKNFFKTYNQFIRYQDLREGNNYKIGDKFYLVFVKGVKLPYMFAAKEYNLAQSEKDKLKTIEEAKEYINLKEFVLETEAHSEKKIINSKKIINDFFDKRQKQTVLFLVAGTLGLLAFGIIIYISNPILIALIMILFAFAILLMLSIVKIKYLLTVINNIKNNNYKIKEDEVVSLNNGIRYSDSNEVISFKFKNYKKIVYADKKDFLDVVIGDKIYLVFVKGEKEPIKVYNVKNSILEN